MKKVVSFALVLVMLFACATCAFAANTGNFIKSPSASGGPVLVDFSNEDPNCKAELAITSYRDRATLPQDKQKAMEDCYEQILNAASLPEIMKFLDASKTDLYVSDLFDLSYYDCDIHEAHGGFTITIKADSLDKFVALTQYNGTGWENVKNVKVSADKTTLTFFVESLLSPFAIVVNAKGGVGGAGSNEEPKSPQTNDNSVYFLVAGTFFALCSASFLALSRKKRIEE